MAAPVPGDRSHCWHFITRRLPIQGFRAKPRLFRAFALLRCFAAKNCRSRQMAITGLSPPQSLRSVGLFTFSTDFSTELCNLVNRQKVRGAAGAQRSGGGRRQNSADSLRRRKSAVLPGGPGRRLPADDAPDGGLKRRFSLRRKGKRSKQPQHDAVEHAGRGPVYDDGSGDEEHLGGHAGDESLCECQVRDKNFIRRLCNLGYCTTTE